MDHDFFTFESSWEDFNEANPQPARYHITNVWHEMGHFIGHRIAGRYGFDFGEVSQIDFGTSPHIILKSIYSPLGKVDECQDYYGFQNLCFQDPEDITRISAAVKDKKKTLAYILYLLCGGYFNIYIIKSQPTEEDFEDCYLDSAPDAQWDNFTARAGNDWSKTRRLAQIDRWDFACLKELRSDLYYLLYKYSIFDLCKDALNSIDASFNGKKIDLYEIEQINTEIEICLNKIQAEFWDDLSGTLNSYAAKF